jgi:hypothetical protein
VKNVLVAPLGKSTSRMETSEEKRDINQILVFTVLDKKYFVFCTQGLELSRILVIVTSFVRLNFATFFFFKSW